MLLFRRVCNTYMSRLLELTDGIGQCNVLVGFRGVIKGCNVLITCHDINSDYITYFRKFKITSDTNLRYIFNPVCIFSWVTSVWNSRHVKLYLLVYGFWFNRQSKKRHSIYVVS